MHYMSDQRIGEKMGGQSPVKFMVSYIRKYLQIRGKNTINLRTSYYDAYNGNELL